MNLKRLEMRMLSMNKPQLYVAMSASLALLQANSQPALSEPAAPSIWQKLAGVNQSVKVAAPAAKAAVKVAGQSATAARKPVIATSAHSVAASSAGGQAMLFFKSKDADGGPASHAPAAALTIHPSLPLTADTAATTTAQSKEAPTLVAMTDIPNGALKSEPKPELKAAPSLQDKQLVAQLSPDQIIAQGDQSGGTTSTPIPPVVSG